MSRAAYPFAWALLGLGLSVIVLAWGGCGANKSEGPQISEETRQGIQALRRELEKVVSEKDDEKFQWEFGRYLESRLGMSPQMWFGDVCVLDGNYRLQVGANEGPWSGIEDKQGKQRRLKERNCLVLLRGTHAEDVQVIELRDKECVVLKLGGRLFAAWTDEGKGVISTPIEQPDGTSRGDGTE